MNVISLQVDSSSSAARFRACRVFQARRDVSDLERLLISSVLTNESPPTRLGGWGLPKLHSQVLISYTWLPLRDPWLAPSAHPNSKACFCRGAYLYGMVDVALHEESKEREAPAQEGPLSYRSKESGQERVHTANDHVM